MINLENFHWDEETQTFSTDLSWIAAIFTESKMTIKAGSSSTLKAGDDSNLEAGSYSTLNAGSGSTLKAGDDSSLEAERKSTLKAGWCSTLKAGWNSTLEAGGGSNLDADGNSTLKAGPCSILMSGGGTTFSIEDFSQVITYENSIINVLGDETVIINRNVFEVILPKKGDVIQICPYKIEGHLCNGIYSETGKESIIADGILSEVISKRKGVYKVKNHGEEKISFLVEVERNGKKIYSHGQTLKQARESLVYKLSDRDKSKWESLKLDSVLTKEEAIECYMTITGACEAGTRYFVERQEDLPKKMKIEEIIELTKGQFGNREFEEFFKN